MHGCLLLFIEVCPWNIAFVTLNTTKGRIQLKFRRWYNVSVSYPKPGFVENTGTVEHYSVFSARLGLGYGTLIQYMYNIKILKYYT